MRISSSPRGVFWLPSINSLNRWISGTSGLFQIACSISVREIHSSFLLPRRSLKYNRRWTDLNLEEALKLLQPFIDLCPCVFCLLHG